MPGQNLSPIGAPERVVLVASRLFVAYLLFWVVDDITLLPREVLSIMHYIHDPVSSYLLHGSILDILGNLLRMALWLMAAGWFYRCGPRIRDFFTVEAEEPAAE